jgi:starch phosphorylase
MTSQSPLSPAIDLQAKLPPPLHPLIDLAFNFWWSWSADGASIFRDLDAQKWEQCHQNPVEFLATLSDKRLTQFATDRTYLRRVEARRAQLENYLQQPNTWAAEAAPQITPEHPIAYFCVEFGLHQSLQIYAGGLGVLAGDHLKTASDLGLPTIGVGLLYRHGYFKQHFTPQGWQEDEYPDYQAKPLPLELVRDEGGEPLTVEVKIRKRCVKVQAWRVRVGRVNLYLLDTEREDNDPLDRAITAYLYGGDEHTRIAQEIAIGIGGVRILQRLGIEPKIYHLNEGHSAFALLELVRHCVQQGQSFPEAKETVRERCLFTTHTPVMAGHDSFPPDLMDEFFSHYWSELGVSREEFLDLGARRPGDPWHPFNMTVLALRLTRAANGVSQLNGKVSRQMWSVLYPDRAEEEVPIGAITNGIHARSWIAPLMDDLYSQFLDENWAAKVCDRKMWDKVSEISDRDIWRCHQLLKENLIAYVRDWTKRARQRRGEGQESIAASENLLESHALTIGFARRFSPYKRGDLILHDPQRASQIFSNAERPVQIIFAGKAHPANDESKRIMQRLIEWSRDPNLERRVVFIEDYDIFTAQKLVQGVDVWLNTPRRPMEASGTSGQKVGLNGGINCSILDGWWCEAYQSDANGKGINGWAIGEENALEDQEEQDRRDAAALYRLLEEQIVPLYYDERSDEGLPHAWIEMMKASVKSVAPAFNTERMLADYVRQMYLPEARIAAQPALAISQ